MTKTFDDDMTSNKDKVRAALGETNTTTCYLSDEMIDAVLGQNSDDLLKSGLVLCDMLVAYYSSAVDTKNGRLSVGASKRATQYRQLRADLQRRPSLLAPSGTGSNISKIVVGGASVAEYNRVLANTDNVRPAFDNMRRPEDIIYPQDEVVPSSLPAYEDE